MFFNGSGLLYECVELEAIKMYHYRGIGRRPAVSGTMARHAESTEGLLFFAHREAHPPRLARMAGVAAMGQNNLQLRCGPLSFQWLIKLRRL